jgi:transposase
MGRPSKWSPEFREEAVRMYRESDESIAAVARRLGLGPETFRRWVREDEVERGQRDGTTREEHAEIVKLRREVRTIKNELGADAARAMADARSGRRAPARALCGRTPRRPLARLSTAPKRAQVISARRASRLRTTRGWPRKLNSVRPACSSRALGARRRTSGHSTGVLATGPVRTP